MHESSIKTYGWFMFPLMVLCQGQEENVQILRLYVQVKMETMVNSVGNY